jgi:predicted metal-dependent hydrolase
MTGMPPAQPGLFDAAEPEPTVTSAPEPFRVEVTRSKRRKRTVGAQLRDGVLFVALPSWMSGAEEAHWVAEMSRRFRRKASADRIDLAGRSRVLARRLDLPVPTEVRWSDAMNSRWGSCTPGTRTVRISSRIATYPDWVVDYVLVHELAHLARADHSPAFWALVHRYPQAERAIGYLIAKSDDETEPDDVGAP